MKPGFYTACLPSLRAEEAVQLARELGYGGIEWRVDALPDPSSDAPLNYRSNNWCTMEPDAAAAERIGRLCTDAGIAVIGVAPYLAVGDMAAMRRAIALAQASGGRHVRVWASRRLEAGYAAALEETRDYLRAAVPIARAARVVLAIETHQFTICPSAELTLRLIGEFDPAVVGVIYDVGNMGVEGYADHRIGAALIGDRIVNVHIKNVIFEPRDDGPWTRKWSPCDVGIVDVPRALAALREHGYAGWVSLEDFSEVRDDRSKLRYSRELMRKWL